MEKFFTGNDGLFDVVNWEWFRRLTENSSMEPVRKYDLEDRLIEYGCRMIDVVETLPNTHAGIYIAGQLIKSCLSPTFNYGELIAIMSKSIVTAKKNRGFTKKGLYQNKNSTF